MNFKEIKNILISDDVSQKCIDILENNNLKVTKNTKLSKQELLEEIKKYDCLIVRSATKVTAEVLESAGKSLKLVARAGTGVDNIDIVSASKAGVVVMNAVGSNTISAVELTCGMFISLARQLPLANQTMKEGKWERSKFVGTELYNKTLAIVGLGRIGKEVAQRMKSFGMHTIGYDPITSAESAAQVGIEFKSMEEIWPVADYISIHVPLLPETKNMINADVLAKCKKGVRIVNCARGGIVDENALLESLKAGHCAGAGLDVFDEEPPKNFDLINHPNVVCTPHLGASTVEAQTRVAIDIAEQIVNLIKNDKIEGVVNPNVFEKQN